MQPYIFLGSDSTASKSFKDIVSSFLFFALMSKKGRSKKKEKTKEAQPLTVADASSALMRTITEVNGSPDNIMFWTNYQNELLAGNYKHIKLGFQYGTGLQNSLEYCTIF